MNTHQEMIEYLLDTEDRIISVSSTWDLFACDNEAPELTAASVLNTHLWEYIDGVETRTLLKDMIEIVHRNGTTLTYPFRCDAPTLARYLEMTILRTQEGHIRLQSRTVKTEPMCHVRLLERNDKRSAEVLEMCSFCKNVKVASNAWVPPNTAVESLNLFDAPQLPQLTHGVCPKCLPELEARLKV